MAADQKHSISHESSPLFDAINSLNLLSLSLSLSRSPALYANGLGKSKDGKGERVTQSRPTYEFKADYVTKWNPQNSFPTHRSLSPIERHYRNLPMKARLCSGILMRAGRKALSTLAQGRGVEDIEGLFCPHTEKREGFSTSNLDLGSVGSCKFQLSPR